jgi:hypothetical protein
MAFQVQEGKWTHFLQQIELASLEFRDMSDRIADKYENLTLEFKTLKKDSAKSLKGTSPSRGPVSGRPPPRDECVQVRAASVTGRSIKKKRKKSMFLTEDPQAYESPMSSNDDEFYGTSHHFQIDLIETPPENKARSPRPLFIRRNH